MRAASSDHAFAPGPRDPWSRVVRAVAQREREVRDILWLLLTLAWVLAPHAAELPPWCTVSVLVLMLWRGWLTWRGHRLPHRFIPVTLTCVAGFAVWMQYRTIFGKDAGVTFVVLLLGLKLLEMRAQRDIFVVIFLCLFVMLTSLFESQSMLIAAMLIFGLWMLVVALVSVQFRTHEPRWHVKAGIAARLVALAMPLMAVLFVLFPRIDGPLWGMPSDAYAAKTGLSDNLSLGGFGSLSQSREIAFRVRFDGPVAAPATRYWRGPVLGAFDGTTWTGVSERFRRGPPGAAQVQVDARSAVDYTVTLEPSNRPWLFTLDVPVDAPRSTALATRIRSDLQVVSDRLVRDRVTYAARSYTSYRAGQGESRVRMQDWLELPAGFNPRTHAFAARLLDEANARGTPTTPEDESRRNLALIDRVLTMIRTEGYVYTLEPPPLGRDAIDEFLFDTRRGFCEHYASAFVVLMRALDIPSRIVTGYQGGEINPVDGYLEVRQLDAHAWAEVWLPDRGWTRVDPTAAVAPNRIELGVSGLQNEATGLARQGTWVSELLRRTRFNWDAVSNGWNQWVLAYNAERQSGLFAGIGIERIDWQVLTIALMLGFGAMLLAIGALTLFRRVRADPVVLLYAKACDTLARAARRESHALARGMPADAFARTPAEGSRDYLARIRDHLPAGLRERADATFALYESLRYRAQGSDPSLRARFARSVAALRG